MEIVRVSSSDAARLSVIAQAVKAQRGYLAHWLTVKLELSSLKFSLHPGETLSPEVQLENKTTPAWLAAAVHSFRK
ncbi:hypothetical protein BH20VER3_BH20VER3_12560 [soil metagenome]